MKNRYSKTVIFKDQVIYEPEDDILNIWLSKGKKLDYAEDENGVITHYTKDGEPIYIEVLDASRFFGKLPKRDRHQVTASVAHKIK